ncbi:daunorubicin resistance protein DrrA family ABC transporter ATP-binding protein [Salinactinospora qingdaonensis]|uniref:Daunorubicin resistance protein DrrA family ABC transporter ATP-binding protein n=1 Tax=Salinactinospora qingdaonensis TaxID=702744 RepID=A0ABP7FAJ5_9ACTN
MPTDTIEVEHLRKTFAKTVALDDVSLTVEQGTVFGVLGPNGAGKTTLINCLTTLLRPDSGRATVAGHDVATHPARVRDSIALTGQFAAVDDALTGRENLVLFGRLLRMRRAAAGAKADELLTRFALEEVADRPVSGYSGGMRRRLDLAISLVVERPVLILDEPTTGLDPRSRQELWQVVRDVRAAGTTILLTTQYLEEADRLADRIAVIDSGRVVAEGTAAELKNKVGGRVCEIRTATAAEATALVETMSEFRAEIGSDERTVLLHADDTHALSEIMQRIDAGGLDPEDVAMRRPTLDEVFLTLTGGTAEADTAETAGTIPANEGAGR